MSMKRYIFILVVFALAITSTSAQEDSNYQRSSKRSEVKGFKPVTDTEKMRRWGIIIGINTYDDPTINSLRYASPDARAIYEVLARPQTGGFKKEQLHLLTSDSGSPPTRNNILESLALLNRMIRAGDTVVFYFSGHGLTQGGINYLLPADTRVNIPTETAIPLSKVYAAIQNARQQIIFLDACHSGQRRDKGTTSGAMSFAFAEAVFSEAEGRVTLASCNINESSFEDDKLGHGVFTYYLLEALRGKADTIADKRITTSEANRYVVEKVKAWAFANRKRQNPRISSNVSGEIVLTTATFPRVPPKPSIDPNPDSTPMVGAFDKTVVQIKALEVELVQNRQRVDENRQRGEQEIAEFRESHKLNAPKDMFESDADYDKRVNQLNALVEKRREALQKRYLEDIQGYLADIQTQIARLYRRIFPTNDVAVTLGTYNANNEFFPITFEVNLNGESRRYNSRISLNKDDARNLYRNWNKVIKTSYFSIDPGYRRALVIVKLAYTPIWEGGVTWELDELYDLGDNNITVAFSPNGKYLATGNTDRKATLWEMNRGTKVWQMTHGGRVNAVAFSPNGRYLATGDTDRKATLWEMNRGTKVWQVEHRYRSGLVTVKRSVIGGNETRTPQMAEGNVYAATFSPDGKYLATGDSTTNPSRHYARPSRRSRRYAGWNEAGNANIWEINRGVLVRRMTHEIPTGYARVTRDVFGGNRAEYKEVVPGGRVNALSFSPDGKYLATGSKNVTVWKVSSGQRVRQIEDGGWVYAVSFSPDGKYLATGSAKKASIWEVNSDHRLWQMEHGGSVNAVSFSPDGQYLAVGGDDKAITFYRVPTNITIDTKITKERVIQASSKVKNLAWGPYGNLISDGKKVYRTLLQLEIVKETR